MKGLILAGGDGTRLRPLTYTGAKQLLPVANRPVLFYAIDNLVDAGVCDIGVIISPGTGEEVKSTVGDGSAWGARLRYILQRRPAGLAHAVRTAREYLGDDDFCMYLGDNLIGMPVKDAAARFTAERDTAATILLKEVRDPSSFGVAEVDDRGCVLRIVEKPAEPRSNLAVVGVYLFRRSIHGAIDRIAPSARGELEITDAIAKLVETGARVRSERVDSWWLDTGKKDDLLLANATVLDTWLVHDVRGHIDAASRITGRVRIEEGATVVRSSIRGPAVIGAGARIVDSRVGPFSSIGANVTVERSGLEHCVLLEHSRILGVPRLEDSLIGRRVVLQPRPAHHAALSLLVGDDCRVELAEAR